MRGGGASGSAAERTMTIASRSASFFAAAIASPGGTDPCIGCPPGWWELRNERAVGHTHHLPGRERQHPTLSLRSVKVTVRLFAGLRERAGWSRREVNDVTRVRDVWERLDLGHEPPGLLYAVNKEYAAGDDELADGDEVALIPPVSGGAFRLSEGPL